MEKRRQIFSQVTVDYGKWIPGSAWGRDGGFHKVGKLRQQAGRDQKGRLDKRRRYMKRAGPV